MRLSLLSRKFYHIPNGERNANLMSTIYFTTSRFSAQITNPLNYRAQLQTYHFVPSIRTQKYSKKKELSYC